MNGLPGMPAELGLGRVLGLLTVAAILGGGQLLFKIAAARLTVGKGPAALALSFATLPMLAALVLYGIATVLWVYLLHGLPLSRAYPFIAIAFAFVPILSWIVFGDALGIRYAFGIALLLAGLYLVASGR